MESQQFGSGSPKSFSAYPRGDFDIESGLPRRVRRARSSHSDSAGSRFRSFCEKHWVATVVTLLTVGSVILIFLSASETPFRSALFRNSDYPDESGGLYPFAKLCNLVMVAGHSICTSTGCGGSDKEESWFLESYQKHRGQASTFLAHIKVGVDIAAMDDRALLLFSGGETRKEAGPRSEAQSYWTVAESKGWFGTGDSVRSRALTEEHARDSYENLLFSICRFRELTGKYPENITVVSYDFKEERFSHLHRLALRFPEKSFFFSGTPATPTARDSAAKGEAAVRALFGQDPYGCLGTLHEKRLKRDPFHRSVPYPNGCPELRGLFQYCGPAPYPGRLPWAK